MKFYFEGKIKWAKIIDEPKEETFEHKGKKIVKKPAWTLNLYPTEKALKAFKNSNSQLKVREDEDGEFISFSRPLWGKDKDGNDVKRDPPRILDKDGNVMKGIYIGNGSDVTVLVDIYNTRMGPGTRLEAVRVENLIEYDKNKVSEDATVDVPF